jgi:endo-1,4-beta-xylanase
MSTRRAILIAGLQLAAYRAFASSADLLVSSKVSVPLKAAGAPCGLRVGVQAANSLLKDPRIAQLIASNFNLLTVGGMKWDVIHPEPATFNFSEADWGISFARRNGMLVHGHNLCWNSPAAYPPWFRTVLNKTNAEHYLTQHIHTVVTHYKGAIDSWDVVNEPVVSWSKRSGLLYPGVWLDLIGPEYIDIAFRATAEADPAALRVLNIYHVESETPDSESTRRATIALLEGLKTRGVPIRAVGLESHLDVTQPQPGNGFAHFLEQIRSLGLRIMITELDVTESRANGTSRDWDRAVAACYGNYLDLVLPFIDAHRLVFWSLQDRWEGGRRIQGLLQANLSPRLSLDAVELSLQRSCT